MNSLSFVTRGSRGDQLLDKVDEQRFKSARMPEHPVLQPVPMGNETSWQMQPAQAESLRLLTFAGKGFTPAPHLELEHRFIQALRSSTSKTEKAGLAEMLGRTRSMNALPVLSDMLDSKQPPEVRTAAVRALGAIGASTNKNSFTRTQLADTLLHAYSERKKELEARLEKPLRGSFAAKQKEGEQRELLVEELKALAVTISELEVAHARGLLQNDYRKSLALTERAGNLAQQLRQAVEMAQRDVMKALQKQYNKPLKEILSDLGTDEINAIKSRIQITTEDGETLSMQDLIANLRALESRQHVSAQLVIGIMEGLSKFNDNEVNAVFKLGLSSSHPQVKAKSLDILAERNGVNYNSDVYPNLISSDKGVRHAALNALLVSPEYAAKQKALELLSPKAFFEVLGQKPSANGLAQYAQFLERIAEDGDKYVQALSKRALNTDYDIGTRLTALLVLGMMCKEEVTPSLSARTIQQASLILNRLVEAPQARVPEEGDLLQLMATQQLIELKDPQAIANGIVLAAQDGLDNGTRESLLATVLGVLQADANRTEAAQQRNHQYSLLDVLHQSGLIQDPAELETELNQQHGQEAGLRPTLAHVAPSQPDAFAPRNQRVQVNAGLVKQLAGVQEQLRDYLEALLDDETSMKTRMLSSRIVGLLQDRMLTDRLIDRVRDPLQGKLDWSAERSYRGNPSVDGANIRLNALAGLGRMGDARALDVMLDALDDPILRDYVIEPLGMLAKSVNAKADEATLANVHQKLIRILESPDTGRGMRAVRIKAADTLFQFKGGVDALKAFAARTDNTTFRRHALSALVSNNYALDPKHPDHHLVKSLVQPELGVERLHAKGITGKGIEMGIIDGGYVDKTNTEAFQNRVKLPPQARNPEHYHPTMVMSTAAANGAIKGVAPDTVVYSDKWPDFGAKDPMEVYKSLIEGKLRGENNIRVINNSWGFSNQNVIVFKDVRTILQEFKKVVDLAERAGIQIVFAAGNSGEEPGVPKLGTMTLFGMDVDKLTDDEKDDLSYILDRVITVGAVNTNDTNDVDKFTMAEFSSVGDSMNRKLLPTLAAPGADMMVYGWENTGKQPKELVNGTSFASPYVSGAIALMFQKNPKLTPAQVRDILVKTARPLEHVSNTVQGAGIIDPEAAIQMAGQVGKRRTRTAANPPKASDTPKPPTDAAKPDEAAQAPKKPDDDESAA